MAKYFSSLLLITFCLCVLAPVSVHADRYQARFELVSSIGLSYTINASGADASQCSPEFRTGNSGDASCFDFSASLSDFFEHETTLSVDGVERSDWRQSGVSEGDPELAFADEISMVLQ